MRNPDISKKMLKKSKQFLSSEQPCEPKSLDVALNTAGVDTEYARKTCGCGQHWRPFDSSVECTERYRRWKFVWSVVGDAQISLT